MEHITICGGILMGLYQTLPYTPQGNIAGNSYYGAHYNLGLYQRLPYTPQGNINGNLYKRAIVTIQNNMLEFYNKEHFILQ